MRSIFDFAVGSKSSAIRGCCAALGCRKRLGLQPMHQAIVELMVAADMVGVGMGGDGVTGLSISGRVASCRLEMPMPVSISRSRSRPRTCQILQRMSGMTCGSHSSVMSSSIRRVSNQRSAICRDIGIPSGCCGGDDRGCEAQRKARRALPRRASVAMAIYLGTMVSPARSSSLRRCACRGRRCHCGTRSRPARRPRLSGRPDAPAAACPA